MNKTDTMSFREEVGNRTAAPK